MEHIINIVDEDDLPLSCPWQRYALVKKKRCMEAEMRDVKTTCQISKQNASKNGKWQIQKCKRTTAHSKPKACEFGGKDGIIV